MTKHGTVALKWIDPNSGDIQHVNFGLGDRQVQINGKKAVDVWILTEIETFHAIDERG